MPSLTCAAPDAWVLVEESTTRGTTFPKGIKRTRYPVLSYLVLYFIRKWTDVRLIFFNLFPLESVRVDTTRPRVVGSFHLKKMQLLVAQFFFVLGVANCISPQIRVEQGDLTGTTYTLKNGRTLFAFLGIPYAVPLTHKNRFKVSRRAVVNCENIDEIQSITLRRNRNP